MFGSHPKFTIRKIFFRSILVCISLLIALLLLEGALRFAQTKFAVKEEYEELSMEKSKQQLDTLLIKQHIEKDTYNIYYFGESTMKGIPFDDTLPRLISLSFHDAVNGKPIRWVNLGESGIDMAFSADLIKWIIGHRDIYYPSLLIVYSGHNEFLKFQSSWGFEVSVIHTKLIDGILNHSQLAKLLFPLLHFYKLDINERSFFDKQAYSQAQYDEVLQKYENNIRDVEQLAKVSGIPLIISTVVGNYTDFEPDRSVCDAGADAKMQFLRLMREGYQSSVQGKYDESIQTYNKALTACPKFAEAYFQLGKVYEAKSQYDAAWDAYQIAIDLDQMPIRSQSKQNDFIRKQASESGVFVSDSIDYVRNHTQHGLIGYNVMSDGHHPNLEGYLLIAESIAQTMSSKIFQNNITPEIISVNRGSEIFLPDRESEYYMYYWRADWFLRLATWVYDPSRRIEKAQEYLRDAITLEPENYRAYALYATLAYLQKNTQEANIYVKKAMSRDWVETIRFFRQPWVVQVVIRALLT